MIRITQLKLSVNHTEVQLQKKIARTLKCPEGSFSYEIIRQSLDARHKEDKKFVYTVDVVVPNEKQILKKVHNKNIMSTEKKEYQFPKPGEVPGSYIHRSSSEADRPVFFVPGIWQKPAIVLWFWSAVSKHPDERRPWIASGRMVS